MKARMQRWWDTRTPRERRVVAVLTALLAVLLYLWLVHSSYSARARLNPIVTALRAQAVGLEQQAAEYGRLRATPAVTSSVSDLRALILAHAGAAGLSRALPRIEATGPDQVQVVMGAVPFADWLNWVAGLQAQQVRLEACRIEAMASAGLVSVTATLVRTRLP